MSRRTSPLLAPERRERILELVARNKSVLVKDLCAQFDVTSETIRKDLSILEQEGRLLKTYGGAYVREGVQNEIYASLRATIFTEEKDAIGRACASFVQNGDTVILDESTTCRSIAKQLVRHENLTVITNSLKIADILTENESIQLLMIGGMLDRKNQCLVGGGALNMLQNYYADRGFVSCRGLDRGSGVTDNREINGSIRRLMLQRSQARYLVVDQTKLNLTNFYKICDFDLIHTVVIDRLEDPLWREFFVQQGVRVVEAQARY